MFVLVMDVVYVRMLVVERLVDMLVLMAFAQVQPRAGRHERGTATKCAVGRSPNAARDNAAPTNGARAKYAPVRAVPRPP